MRYHSFMFICYTYKRIRYNKFISHFKFILLWLLFSLFPFNAMANSSFDLCVLAEKTGGSCIPMPSEGQDTPEWEQLFQDTVYNSLSSTIQPTIISATPNNLPQGSTADITINAPSANFNTSSLTKVTITEGIKVNTGQLISSTKLVLNITIADDVPVGSYDMEIVTQLSGKTETASGKGILRVSESTGTARILSVNPNIINANSTSDMLIYGKDTNFNESSIPDFSNDKITIVEKTVHSNELLGLKLNIAADARQGLHNVKVTTDSEVATNTQVGILQVYSENTTLPEITMVIPERAEQGKTANVKFVGKNIDFMKGIKSITFEGSGIDTLQHEVIDATTLIAQIEVADDAQLGGRNVHITTNDETASSVKGFSVFSPMVVTLTTSKGEQGKLVSVPIKGQETHFVENDVTFTISGEDITVESVNVNSATSATAILNIAANAKLGQRNVGIVTGSDVAALENAFEVIPPQVASTPVTTETVVLTVKAQGDGQGTLTQNANDTDCATGCELTLNKNTQLVLMAEAKTDSNFVKWSGENCFSTQQKAVALLVTTDTTCIAEFELKPVNADPVPPTNDDPPPPTSDDPPPPINDDPAPPVDDEPSPVTNNPNGESDPVEDETDTSETENDSNPKEDEQQQDDDENKVVGSPPSVPILPTCSKETVINRCSMQTGTTIGDMTIEEKGNISGDDIEVQGHIDNYGTISSKPELKILPAGSLTGGKVSGYVNNQGMMSNFNFVGGRLEQGILAGHITVSPKSILKNVALDNDTYIDGGILRGQIIGQENEPAYIDNATISSNASLENVILGENVVVEYGAEIKAFPELPELSQTSLAIQADGQFVETETKFLGGVTLENEIFDQALVVTKQQDKDKVRFNAHIHIDSEDIGKKADLLLVMGTESSMPYSGGKDTTSYVVINQEGEVKFVNLYAEPEVWMPQLTTPFKADVTLRKEMHLTFSEKVFNNKAMYYLFVGYCLQKDDKDDPENGKIIYAPVPVMVKVQ